MRLAPKAVGVDRWPAVIERQRIVISSVFGRKSQSKANMQCKLRNLKTNAVVARNFQGSEKIEPADKDLKTEQMNRDCSEAEKIIKAFEKENPLAAYPLGKLQQDGMI